MHYHSVRAKEKVLDTPAQNLLASSTNVNNEHLAIREEAQPNSELTDQQKTLDILLNKKRETMKSLHDVGRNYVKDNLQLIIESQKDVKSLDLLGLTSGQFKMMCAQKVPVLDMFISVISTSPSEYSIATGKLEPSPKFIAKQAEFVRYLIDNGLDLKAINIRWFPKDFTKNHPLLVKEVREAQYISLEKFLQEDMEMEPIVLKLISNTFIHQNFSPKRTEELLKEFYDLHKIVGASPTIARVLNYIYDNTNQEIYIDPFRFLRESQELFIKGALYHHSDKICLSPYIHRTSSGHIAPLTSTIIHELFHKVLRMLYENDSNPYSKNDIETKSQISDIIEEELSMQDLLKEYYNSWFNIQLASYTREQYGIELFPWLIHTLVESRSEEQENKSRCTREFTEEVWKILQKIVSTIPTKDGTPFTPEPVPESIMLSVIENNCINYEYAGKCMELLGNTLANFFGDTPES